MSSIHIDIKRIEFVITNTCSGKCRHCSAALPEFENGSVDAEIAVNAIKQLTGRYAVESLMTFGGEPLLYADTTCKIHAAARDCGIPIRQIITNGFFSRDKQRIEDVAEALCASGANDVLLSADAFHQEYIPVEPVIFFAESLIKNGIPKLRVHPAWLVNDHDQNPYNVKTIRILKMFKDKGIESSKGNNIFPAGNALKYLRNYFQLPETLDLSVPCGQMPYTSRLDEIDSISINPNGDLILCSFSIGNVCKNDVISVIDGYDPYRNPATRALMEGGAGRLLDYANKLGAAVDTSGCFTACEVCRKVMAVLKNEGVL